MNGFLLQAAIELAKKHHKNQRDLAGKPYIGHLERVANSLHTDEQKIVAYLHDILEDTDCTESSLEIFSDRVITAIKTLTKPKKHISFPNQYFDAVKNNPLARTVKLADLKDNMNLNRLKNPTKKDLERVEEYKKVYEYLS